MSVNDYLKDILGTTSKIALWVKIIAILLFVFCTWMCANYFFQHYPDAEVTSKPFDYNGMLVGFFTLLVTLLVGWNIYSTISAKEELEKAKDKLKEQYKEDIAKLKADVDKLKIEQQAQATKETEEATKTVDAMREISEQNVSLAAILNTRAYETVQRQILIEGTKLRDWLYDIIDASMSIEDIYAKYLEVKAKHPEKVSFINGRDATRNEVLETINMVRPIKLTLLRIADKDK